MGLKSFRSLAVAILGAKAKKVAFQVLRSLPFLKNSTTNSTTSSSKISQFAWKNLLETHQDPGSYPYLS